MLRGAALIGVLALAACSPSAPDAQPRPAATVTPLPPVIQGGWATVFGDAKASIELFTRLGLRPGAYARDGDRYVSKAVPTPLSDPSVKPTSVANFTATGGETTLDSVAFALDSVGADKATAKAEFGKWVGQAMSRLGVAGSDVVLPAIAAETAKSGTVDGAAYAVTSTPIAGGTRLTVTFTSPASDRGSDQPRK